MNTHVFAESENSEAVQKAFAGNGVRYIELDPMVHGFFIPSMEISEEDEAKSISTRPEKTPTNLK